MSERFTLETGEKKSIKKTFLGAVNVNIVYCGMPSENVFSLGLLENEGNTSYSMNFFFPKRSTQVALGKYRFYVNSVTADNITLQPFETK
jgi:hypothetical protein